MVLTSRGVLRLALFISGYIAFLIVGATLFSAIEGPEETSIVQKLKNARSSFLKKHKCVSGKFFSPYIIIIAVVQMFFFHLRSLYLHVCFIYITYHYEILIVIYNSYQLRILMVAYQLFVCYRCLCAIYKVDFLKNNGYYLVKALFNN